MYKWLNVSLRSRGRDGDDPLRIKPTFDYPNRNREFEAILPKFIWYL
jgi:hypothetical protein